MVDPVGGVPGAHHRGDHERGRPVAAGGRRVRAGLEELRGECQRDDADRIVERGPALPVDHVYRLRARIEQPRDAVLVVGRDRDVERGAAGLVDAGRVRALFQEPVDHGRVLGRVLERGAVQHRVPVLGVDDGVQVDLGLGPGLPRDEGLERVDVALLRKV
jgi:hypothetical protein